MGLLRRLYDWVTGWAETRFGAHALAAVSFAESSVFPVPPDPLLLALCLGRRKRALVFALVATVASVLGGVLGYWIGAELWAAWGGFFFEHVPGVNESSFTRVQELYRRWDFGAVVFAGLTPVPYKVFALAAGVFGIDFPTFVAASLVGRASRFFSVALLIHFFGRSIKGFIDRYFSTLVWILGLLLVGGFVALKLL